MHLTDKIRENFLSCATFTLPAAAASELALALARRDNWDQPLQADRHQAITWTRTLAHTVFGDNGLPTTTRHDVPRMLFPLGDIEDAKVMAFALPVNIMAESFKESAAWQLKRAGFPKVPVHNMRFDIERCARDEGCATNADAHLFKADGRNIFVTGDFSMRLEGLNFDPDQLAGCTRMVFERTRPYLTLAK